MQLNVKEFEYILQYVSVNNAFDFIQLIVSKDKVKSNITTATGTLSTMLEFDNDFIIGMEDNELCEFNFMNANITILPHLKLFTDDIIDLTLSKSKGFLVDRMDVVEKSSKSKAKWNMSFPVASRIMKPIDIDKAVSFFASIDISEDFYKKVQTIKKVAFITNKLYIVSDGSPVLSLETGDRTQKTANTFQIDIFNPEEEDDAYAAIKNFNGLAMWFDAKLVISILEQVEHDNTFKCKFAYKPEKKLGLLVITNDKDKTFIIPQNIEGS